jgi:predicted nucleic acid-binding protein
VIVIDSSVWIGLLRNSDSSPVRRLRDIVDAADDQVLVGDLILLEVLQGARDEAHATRIERNLRPYPIAPMLDDAIAVQAARNDRVLSTRGVTVRRTIDMIIGTFCVAGGHALLHDDRYFEPMVAHLGLRMVPV